MKDDIIFISQKFSYLFPILIVILLLLEGALANTHGVIILKLGGLCFILWTLFASLRSALEHRFHANTCVIVCLWLLGFFLIYSGAK